MKMLSTLAVALACFFILPSIAYSPSIELDAQTSKHYQRLYALTKVVMTRYKIRFEDAIEYVSHVLQFATKHKKDPMLFLAIAGRESSFNKDAVSPVGAIGLMQVVPFKDREGMRAEDLKDPYQNVLVAASIYYRNLELSKGNVCRALQRYNGSLWDDTREYSKLVAEEFNTLSKLAGRTVQMTC